MLDQTLCRYRSASEYFNAWGALVIRRVVIDLLAGILYPANRNRMISCYDFGIAFMTNNSDIALSFCCDLGCFQLNCSAE